MPTNLHRYYGSGYSHFITTSCYQRRVPHFSRSLREVGLFADTLPTLNQRSVVASDITLIANPAQFWSMRPETRSFTSAKSPEPIGSGHPWRCKAGPAP
jgi:hypothetical protein